MTSFVDDLGIEIEHYLSLLLHHEQFLVDVGQSDFFGFHIPPRQDSFDGFEVVQIDSLQNQSVDERGIDDVEVPPGIGREKKMRRFFSKVGCQSRSFAQIFYVFKIIRVATCRIIPGKAVLSKKMKKL